MKTPVALSLIALTVAGCQTATEQSFEPLAQAAMTTADGTAAGTAYLTPEGDRLAIMADLSNLPPSGTHGFHLHTTGSCDAPDFTSAGGHLNPTGEGHGLEDDDGSHLGDLPNLIVAADGTASASTILRGTRQQVLGWLFDDDGTAVMLHAGPDDGRTDPAGAAGPRIACGVLRRVD